MLFNYFNCKNYEIISFYKIRMENIVNILLSLVLKSARYQENNFLELCASVSRPYLFNDFIS